MIPTILEVLWYVELTGGTFLLGFGVYRIGKGRKRRGWRMVIAGFVLMALYTVFGPDIIIEMDW